MEQIGIYKGLTFLQSLGTFVQYCNNFYNEDYGLYPLADSETIEMAIGQYLTDPHSIDIQMDSVDRENVRDLIINLKLKTR
jgi:hypothetical protein